MKIRPFLTVVVALICVLGMTSCTAIFTGLYGMKKVKPVDEQTITRYSNKYGVPVADGYEMDTSYFSFLFSLDTIRYKEQIKNHYQPLQALYYDNSGQLESFHVNCYAGGFPNLQWDRDEIMTTFPPKQQAPLDSILPLDVKLKYLRPLSQTEKFATNNYDYVVVVHWNRFMGRQSERLIRFVQENSVNSGEKKVKIVYVNTDNIFTERQQTGGW